MSHNPPMTYTLGDAIDDAQRLDDHLRELIDEYEHGSVLSPLRTAKACTADVLVYLWDARHAEEDEI